MLRRVRWLLVAVVLAALPVAARAADPTPTVILRARSLESIAADFKYLAGIVGQGENVQDLDTHLKQIPGIDFKKPFGAYAYVSPGIVDSGFAALLPVTGEKEFLDLLGFLGQQPEKDNDGVYSVKPFGFIPFPIHFRFANGYVYATLRDKASLDKANLLAPAKLFPATQTELLVLSIRFDQVPKDVRDLAASQIDLRLPELVEQKGPTETAAQHKLKVAAGKEVAGVVTALLRDCREIRLHVDLDRKTHTVSAQLTLEGASGSDLTRNIAGFEKTLSPVAGLAGGDAALSVGLNLALPEAVSKALQPVLEEGILRGAETSGDAGGRAVIERLLKALAPTLKEGRLQAAVSVRGPSAVGTFTGVGGIRVQNGSALEQTFRDIVRAMPEKVRTQVQFDHAKAGAASIHRIGAPRELPQAGKVFGDNPLFVTLHGDVLYVAIGANGLDALKQALTLKPGPAPLVQIEASAVRLAGLIETTGKEGMQASARKAFAGVDHDRIRLTVEGGGSLKVRLEARTQLLNFFRLVGESVRP